MPTYNLVLIGSPGGNATIDTVAGAVFDLMDRDARSDDLVGHWLADNEVYEIIFDAAAMPTARALRDDVAGSQAHAPIDICLVPDANRRKRLLIADMDSTIIQQECIDEMADILGLKSRIAAITERAMRGELAFEPALRERVALLAGLDRADLQRVFDERIQLMPGARTLIATMHRHGAFTALVSGGFSWFTSRVAAKIGFDADHANELLLADGRLTGYVAEPILGREAKLATLRRYASERGIDMAATLAVGDGANDLAMIEAAGLGVAYHAKPVVAARADVAIRHGDLTALLYLQGYNRAEFVDA